MRIALFGDIHGYIEHTNYLTIELFQVLLSEVEAEVFLQVGDISNFRFLRPLPKPVHFIYGNNDCLEAIEAIKGGKREPKNLIHIPSGHVLTFSHQGETLRVSGLNDLHEPWATRPGEAEEVAACLALRDVDLFLAHGAPFGLGFGRQPSLDSQPLREILEKVRPRYMFLGHMHRFKFIEHQGVKVYSLDQLTREHYILDTEKDCLERIKTDLTPLLAMPCPTHYLKVGRGQEEREKAP